MHRSRRHRRNPSAQASPLALVDGSTGLAFAGGMILGAKNIPGWITLLILGAAEIASRVVFRYNPSLLPAPSTTEKTIVDTSAGMAGWWLTSR